MKNFLSAAIGGARAELVQLVRSPLLILLTVIQAVTFILLVSIFGLTGSMAPTAVVDEDRGPYSKIFIENMEKAHHSFAIRIMGREIAMAAVKRGELVAVITIPRGFSEAITGGRVIFVDAVVDNIDTDMTQDIQRAMPSAIVSFAHAVKLPGIRVRVDEHDLIDHDTGFIPYLAVSGLALAVFIVAGILGAVAVAREFESGTVRLLLTAPVHPLASLVGRILAADLVAALATVFSTGVVIVGFGVVPVHPVEMILALLTSIIIFSCLGAALGAALKRTLPVASLIFGLALPLYIDSGSLEPERFDGNIIWAIGHLSPIYYSVGILEHSFHGFEVTPEPIFLNFIILILWAILMLFLAGKILKRKFSV